MFKLFLIFSLLTMDCAAKSCRIVNCLVVPCRVTTCPAYPGAICRDNYCGGCNAEFYSANGTRLDCTAVA